MNSYHRPSKLAALLLSLLLLAYYYAHSNPRVRVMGAEDALNHYAPIRRRRLQPLATALVNALISLATPTLSEKVIYVINKYYTSYDLNSIAQPENLGEDAFMSQTFSEVQTLPSICDAAAGEVESLVAYNYSIMTTFLDGLGSLEVERIAFVEGSQNISMARSRFQYGAEWQADWIVDSTFADLTVKTYSLLTATVQDPSCGAEQSTQTAVNGTFFIENVEASVLATVVGNTGRIMAFVATSELTETIVRSLSFTYEPFDKSTIGTFDVSSLDDSVPAEAIRNLDDLTAIHPWGDEFDTAFNDYVQRMVMYTTQIELASLLPKPFIRQDEDDASD
jgi:hypothetical protein